MTGYALTKTITGIIEFNNFGGIREFSEGNQWDYLETSHFTTPVFCNVTTQGEIAFSLQTHREDDLSYIRLFAPSEFVTVTQVAIIPSISAERWRTGLGVFRDSWECEYQSNSQFPSKYTRKIDNITDRADTWDKPRCVRPAGPMPTLRTQVQLTLRPLLLAYHNLVIAMPTNMEPQHGCARELLRLAPSIKTAVEKFVKKIEVGSAIRLKIKSGRGYGFVWLMFTRFKTEDIPELGLWAAAMDRVMTDIGELEIPEIVMTMPPPPGFRTTWNDVLRYVTQGFETYTTRVLVAVGQERPMNPIDFTPRPGSKQENVYLLPCFSKPTRGKSYDQVPVSNTPFYELAVKELTRIKEEEVDEKDLPSAFDPWTTSRRASVPKNF